MLTSALALARGAYFISAMTLFGSTELRRLMRARLPHIPRLRLAGLAWMAWAVAAVAAIAWFVLAAAQMTGDPGAVLDGAALQAALHTQFGIGFVLRIAALVLLGAAMAGGWDVAVLAFCAIALAVPAWTGHAAASSPAQFTAIGATIDALHLLTAGFWLGGLVLLAILFARKTASADLLLVLGLFSEWAMIAVLLLAMSGLINISLVLLGAPGGVSPLYLGVLGLKLACVGGMLALAAINRFRLMPKFDAAAQARLKRNIALELGLGIAAAGLAGLLGQLAPTLG